MTTIDINNAKSYASEANLNKATASLDASLSTMKELGGIKTGTVRKMVCRNAEGRWSAAYFLTGDDAVSIAIYIAQEGFMAIG